MKKSGTPLCLLLTLFMTTALMVQYDASASPENWSELKRFTGIGSREMRITENFTVGYAEWRIRWSYTFDPEFKSGSGLVVFTYPSGENVNYVDTIFSVGGEPSNGTSYIHNHTGTFYMTITAPDADLSYTLIIEQDLDSVPEFQSPLIVLALLSGMTLLTVLTTRKRKTSTSPNETDAPFKTTLLGKTRSTWRAKN